MVLKCIDVFNSVPFKNANVANVLFNGKTRCDT